MISKLLYGIFASAPAPGSRPPTDSQPSDVETQTSDRGAAFSRGWSRIPDELVFAFGGEDDRSLTNRFETYDKFSERWFAVDEVDPSGPSSFYAVATIGFNIYVIGGVFQHPLREVSTVRRFDAVAKVWTQVAPMDSSRGGHCVAVLDGRIYAIGGYHFHEWLDSVEVYSPEVDRWRYIAPMWFPRSNAGAAALNGKIYVAGGSSGQRYLSSVEMYDAVTNQWTRVADMNFERFMVSCVAHRGCVFAIGGGTIEGVSVSKDGERYDPVDDTWRLISNMSSRRVGFASVGIDDEIYVIGGFNGATVTPQVERYDSKVNDWRDGPPLMVGRKGLAVGVIRNLPNTRQYVHVLPSEVDIDRGVGGSQQGPSHAANVDVAR